MNASDSCSPLFAGATALLAERFAQATSLVSSGNYQQALDIFQELLAACPHEYTLQNNCAWLFEKLGRYAEAETAYRGLFEEMPGYANGALGYARMLERDKRYATAVAVLRSSVASNPTNPRLLSGLGNALIMAGESEAALLWYALSVELDRHDRATVSNFLYALLMVNTISPQVVARELDACAAIPGLAVQISKITRQLHNLDSDFITRMHRRFWGTCLLETSPVSPICPAQHERIRVGYLSADLYSHPVGYFLEGVIPVHDRNRFEIMVFSPYAERDCLTAALRGAAEHWVILNNADRQETLQQVLSCDLDIAVDMAGHTGGNYLDLFARRLAPLQISWGGYPGTTGLEGMDYILVDQVALPAADRTYYTERPLYLPRCYVSFSPPANAPFVGSLPALTNGYVTFGSFNTVQKLNSSTIELWGTVLRELPGSRLFLKSKGFDDPFVCSAFLEKFALAGVSSERVELEGYSPRNELLAAYQKVDIALDPVPYQGGVTVLEALWMGVPTLVLQGSRPPFVRHAESHLMQVGLSDWIAVTKEAYISIVIAWSGNLAGLAALRGRLRQQMEVSALCDTVAFTRDLEAAYQQVWSGISQNILPMS